MTVYTNDPIRIKITMKDLWNLTHKKGINSCAYKSDQDNEYYIKFSCSDTNPFNQREERYKEDILREIERFKVVQDHIREFAPLRRFNTRKSIVKEAILDTKVFGKENRYDILLDKARDVHRLKDGRLFGIIENE